MTRAVAGLIDPRAVGFVAACALLGCGSTLANNPTPTAEVAVVASGATSSGGRTAAPRKNNSGPMRRSERVLDRVCPPLENSTEPATRESNELARSLFHDGLEAYKDARYPLAIELWCRSYDLSGRAALVLNIARVLERQKRTTDAIDAYLLAAEALERQQNPQEADAARASARTLTKGSPLIALYAAPVEHRLDELQAFLELVPRT